MDRGSGFPFGKVVALSCLVFAQACSGPQSGASSSSEASGESSSGEACEVTKKDRITEVKSPRYGYGIMLPGPDWKLTCDGANPLAGDWGFMHMTIELADAELAPHAESERLEKMLERLQAKNQELGLSMISPKIEKTENKLTLTYLLAGLKVGDAPVKSAHVFATIDPRGGAPLVLHYSWTGPESEWKENMDQLLRVLTVSFLPL
jgi:hypothetical protein